ncbi:MAG: DNA-protecting protein DprA [Candidatus Pacebacteria bacterium]|nr:DNA-protecting protein DprA [Candidatus Paceibacterota bacterium]
MGLILHPYTSIQQISPRDPNYPQLLLPLSDRPKVLHVRGHHLSAQSSPVAVVGTRTMTSYGKFMTNTIVRDLVIVGCTIISGLALGIDGEAHRSALKYGGKTIAVLPCGLDVIAPLEHRHLAEDIVQSGGALYSEYSQGTIVRKYHFRDRNRIIAGMSLAVVLIEAGEQSGTQLTAYAAAEYGRPVFAVSGPATSPMTEGIKRVVNEGATLITSAQDVLDALNIETMAPVQKQQTSEIESYLSHHGPATLPELQSNITMSLSRMQEEITHLEIQGKIQQKFGRFQLT